MRINELKFVYLKTLLTTPVPAKQSVCFCIKRKKNRKKNVSFMAFFLHVKQLKLKENGAGRQGFMLPFYLFIKVLMQVQ